MRKVLAILALAIFIVGVSAPAIAANNRSFTVISLMDEDPKKKDQTSEKAVPAENKSEKKAGCEHSTEAKAEKTAEAKKKDCSK
ncbi:MAG TPA: hypothetical protein ENO20_01965 [Bacteroides sp.]|nr:hypothetical protein [Bacteroides sp.]